MSTILIEKHYSVRELAESLALSDAKIRRLFEYEPGVLRIGEGSRRLGGKLRRRYYTLRVPESVAKRVVQRLASSGDRSR